MNVRNQAELRGTTGLPAIFLEIGEPVVERLMELPVTIQNLAADIVTLQADPLGNGWRAEALKGQPVSLRLAQGELQESLAVPGVVRWVNKSSNGTPHLLVGLELASPTPDVRQALKNGIRQTPRDICVLWERWDDLAVQDRRRRFSNRSLTILATALITGGLACQIGYLESFRVFGFLLIFLGMVATGWRVFKTWWPPEEEQKEY